MSGWTDKAVQMIAADLARGAKADIVGGKSLLGGASPQYVEIDGVPVEWPMPPKKEAIGVRTLLPDGYVALYVTTTHERARSMLASATELARPKDAD